MVDEKNIKAIEALQKIRPMYPREAERKQLKEAIDLAIMYLRTDYERMLQKEYNEGYEQGKTDFWLLLNRDKINNKEGAENELQT